MCGEQETIVEDKVREIGSSPRVRGTGNQRRRSNKLLRIIPACAGNSLPRPRPARHTTDHPRVCGEQWVVFLVAYALVGSSPRVRGTGTPSSAETSPSRIIPACAGNRNREAKASEAKSDHPRVCGEQVHRSLPSDACHGSSPRVRGTVRTPSAPRIAARIIPACAGNSTSFRCSNRHTPDHPRVCGEQAARQSESCAASGSSPRVRGTVEAGSWSRPQGRIIPACAGNSLMLDTKINVEADHPRVCGEQPCAKMRKKSSSGSSPRVRGTGCICITDISSLRIIPACAGNRSWRFP